MFAHELTGFMGAERPQARNLLQWAADQMDTIDDDEAETEWTRVGRTDKFQNVKNQRTAARSARRLG